MKNFLMLAALCFAFAGCASSGGNVVGNGLTAGHPMNTMMEDGGCGCGCHEGTADAGSCSEKKADVSPESEDCGCGHKEHHHQKKAK